MSFSLVPLAVAAYFIMELTHYISKENQWIGDCDENKQDSIINRLEWNRIYFCVLALFTLLRLPQWFCQGINFFRKLAIFMWLSHMLLFFFNLTTIWMVNAVLNDDTCSGSVLKDKNTFGWEKIRKQQYWWLSFIPFFALIGMFRSKRIQDCF